MRGSRRRRSVRLWLRVVRLEDRCGYADSIISGADGRHDLEFKERVFVMRTVHGSWSRAVRGREWRRKC